MDAFAELAKEVAGALGSLSIPLVVVPHPVGHLEREQVLQRSRAAAPEMLSKLRPLPALKSHARIDSPPRVVPLVGSWESLNDYFYLQGWTDGLPIAVPTEEKVHALLASIRHPRDH